MMPLEAVFITMWTIVFQRLMPRAREASRYPLGTRRSTSSVVHMMRGIIMNPRASPPA
jgi:hypothetical protein